MTDTLTAVRPAPSARAGRSRPDPRRRRVRTWLSETEWVLATVAILFLAAYAWPILQTDLSRGWQRACTVVQYASWAIFLLDYLARVWAARDRRRYFAKHLLDLLIVALPALRPLRLLRLVIPSGS